MGDFNPNPFKGEASIPHVPEEVFSAVWLGWQVRKEEGEGKGLAHAGAEVRGRPVARSQAWPVNGACAWRERPWRAVGPRGAGRPAHAGPDSVFFFFFFFLAAALSCLFPF